MTETPPSPPRASLPRRILLFPFTRFVLALVFFAVGVAVGSLVRNAVAGLLSLERGAAGHGVLSMLVLVPATYLAYLTYVRVIERRPLSELAGPGALRELGGGVLLGAAVFSAVIASIAALGGYRVLGVNPLLTVLPAFTASVMAGCIEEIVARGIVFRIIEEGLGTWAALVISATLFGLLHHGNPGATWISSTSIALTAGLLLGAAYVVTRRLWMVIGVHFAWNFTQGGVFGAAVSGHGGGGLLRSESGGPELITGGAFGPEASIFAVLVCVPVAAYLLVHGHRRGRFLAPMWKHA